MKVLVFHLFAYFCPLFLQYITHHAYFFLAYGEECAFVHAFVKCGRKDSPHSFSMDTKNFLSHHS